MLFCLDHLQSYLSERGLVHRDLAARNILVGHGKRLKIADFGLMRQMYHEVYEVQKQKKLPIKWMAPESLYDQIFTSKSDVYVLNHQMNIKRKTIKFNLQQFPNSYFTLLTLELLRDHQWDAGEILWRSSEKNYGTELSNDPVCNSHEQHPISILAVHNQKLL